MSPGETKIVIVYDNQTTSGRLQPAWGFACLVSTAKRTLLFDTGGDGSILLGNMAGMGIDPRDIDTVVLSHAHGDHAGGLPQFLAENSSVTVCMGASFPRQFKSMVTAAGASLQEVSRPAKINEEILTTGEMNGGIPEQSLVVNTSRGSVVVTGCAHPGVVTIAGKAKEIGDGRLRLVLGGFHLGWASVQSVGRVMEELAALGVEQVCPCHCTGDQARDLFEQRFGPACFHCGVGRTISLPD